MSFIINAIDWIVWNWDVLRQVICAIALGPILYRAFYMEIRSIKRKLNKANRRAA